jgi:hypothetical protein
MDENEGSLPAFNNGTSRRGFLGWLGKIGMGTVGGAAGLLATTIPAAACCGYSCCCLNYCPPNCQTDSNGQAVCPSGYTVQVWTCCAGTPPFTRRVACAECVPNGTNTCYSWSICSGYWTVNPRGC